MPVVQSSEWIHPYSKCACDTPFGQAELLHAPACMDFQLLQFYHMEV